jgi:hypothetical protein
MTLISLLGMIAHGPAPWLQAEPLAYELALPLLAGRPTIDGRIAEGEWRGAASAFGFRALTSGQLFAPQPQVLLRRDAEALYVAARLPKPKGASPKCAATQHDGPLWNDDAVELFLDPRSGDGRYFQFIVNAAGVTWESVGQDPSFSGQWEAKAGIEEDAWVAEMRVPFATLGLGAPADGAVWGLNVGWDRQTPSAAILTWSPVTKGFHQPEAFRKVAFVEEAPGFTVTETSDPQSGRLEVAGRCDVAPGGSAKAVLSVARVEGGQRTEAGTATAQIGPGDQAAFALRVDLPQKDGTPAPGGYEARLVVTASALTCSDVTVPFAIRPKLEIALRKYVLKEGKVVAEVLAPGLQLPPGEGQLRVQMLTTARQVAKEETPPVPAAGKSAEVTFETGALDIGAHEVRVVATDAQGAQVGTASATFELPPKPAWLGSQEGIRSRRKAGR